MMLLTGEYDLTLDDKYRLLIPARVRDQIDTEQDGGGFYVVMGVNRILNLYPDKYYQRIALAVAPRMVAPDELVTFERINYALAGRVELDRQGRLLLGEKTVRRAGLSEQITLTGARDHLEVWDKQRWEQFLQENIALHEKMLLQAREELLKKDRQVNELQQPGVGESGL